MYTHALSSVNTTWKRIPIYIYVCVYVCICVLETSSRCGRADKITNRNLLMVLKINPACIGRDPKVVSTWLARTIRTTMRLRGLPPWPSMLQRVTASFTTTEELEGAMFCYLRAIERENVTRAIYMEYSSLYVRIMEWHCSSSFQNININRVKGGTVPFNQSIAKVFLETRSSWRWYAIFFSKEV